MCNDATKLRIRGFVDSSLNCILSGFCSVSSFIFLSKLFFILSISILFTKSFHVVSCPGFTGLHIIVLQSGNPGSDQHKHRNIKNKFGKTRFHRTGSLYIIVHSIVRPTQQNINNRVEQTRLHRTTLCNGSLISFFSD